MESIRKIIRAVLQEEFTSLKDLAKDNKYTYPKVPTEKIFSHLPNSNIYQIRMEADKYMNNDLFKELPTQEVPVSKIVPTQKFVDMNNLESTKNIPHETEAYLLEHEGLFYVLDGHHRISNRILQGEPYVNAHVFTQS